LFSLFPLLTIRSIKNSNNSDLENKLDMKKEEDIKVVNYFEGRRNIKN
jgi:hypothetical protein